MEFCLLLQSQLRAGNTLLSRGLEFTCLSPPEHCSLSLTVPTETISLPIQVGQGAENGGFPLGPSAPPFLASGLSLPPLDPNPSPPTPQPLNLSCLACPQGFPLPLSSHPGK